MRGERTFERSRRAGRGQTGFTTMRLAACLLGAVALGCGSGADPSETVPSASGSRSFWLQSCSTTADCGDEAACICNVCTSACSSDSDCSTDDAEGRCSGLIELEARCGEDAAERVCLPSEPPAALCAQPVTRDASLGSAEPSACSFAGALACEDFEGQLSSEYATSWEGDDAPIFQQSCLVAEGDGALSLALEDNWGQLQLPLTDEVSDGALFVRLRAFVPGGTTLPNYGVLFALRHTSGLDPEQVELSIGNDGSFALSAGELFESEAGAFPQGRWACLELELDVANEGSATLWVDEDEVMSASMAQTLPPGGPLTNAVVLGAVRTDETLFEIVVDDFVVATERIGCD